MVDLQRYISYNSFLVNAPVVELVYTLVLEASAERIESSSLSLGTKILTNGRPVLNTSGGLLYDKRNKR